MDEATKKTVEHVISPFGWGMVQDAAALLEELSESGLEPSDLIEYVRWKQTVFASTIYEYRNERLKEIEEIRRNARRCVCGKVMNLFSVNDTSCRMVGGNYNSMWQCSDFIGCGEEILSELTVMDEALKYGLDRMAERERHKMSQKRGRSARMRQNTNRRA